MCAHVQCGLGCTSHLYYLTETGWELSREREGLCGGSWGELKKAVGGEAVSGSCVPALWESDTGKVCTGGNCVGGAVLEKLWGNYVSFMSLIHSQKCSICYSVACLSECVAKVVFVVQSSQTLRMWDMAVLFT